MKQRRLMVRGVLVILLLSGHLAAAQTRQLLYGDALSSPLQEVVTRLQQVDSQPIPYADLNRHPAYFVRIAPRKYVVSEKRTLQDQALLGTKPFVFVTSPEGLYGKTLLQIYLDIGYEAEDIIRWQRDESMVAIVFRYPDTIERSERRDGRLPQSWERHVYVPTWENVFTLFERLARQAAIDADRQGEFAPQQLFFHSESLRQFVLGFPDAGKQRLMHAPYAALKSTGGADWVYRKLLESKLSIFEHFRGNGRTLNELDDPEGNKLEAGLLEFVGPNMSLTAFPELAVVDLGSLTIEDVYRK